MKQVFEQCEVGGGGGLSRGVCRFTLNLSLSTMNHCTMSNISPLTSSLYKGHPLSKILVLKLTFMVYVCDSVKGNVQQFLLSHKSICWSMKYDC